MALQSCPRWRQKGGTFVLHIYQSFWDAGCLRKGRNLGEAAPFAKGNSQRWTQL